MEDYKIIPVGRAKDIRGQKFGRLTVIDRVEKPEGLKEGTYWFCKCKCGNDKVTTYKNLIRGQTSSCGCLASEQSAKNGRKRILDIKGQRFGRLTAVKPLYKKSDWGSIWLFKCECGNFYEAASHDVRRGHTQSCGCFRREKLHDRLELESVEQGTLLFTIGDRKLNSNNSSGVRGVSFKKSIDRWMAYITLKGRRKYLGVFEDKEDAINARKEAEECYFKPILEKYGKSLT